MAVNKPALYLLCLFLFVTAGIRAQQGTNTAEVIAEMENAWGAAVKTKDASALDKMLAADWVGRYPFYTLTKSEELEHVRRGDFNITSISTTDMKIRVFGDAAVVTGTDDEKGSYKGRDTSGRYLWLDVLIKRKGKWQFVASEETLVIQR